MGTTMMRRVKLVVTAVLAISVLSGCQTNRLRQERDALWSQNQELQAELEAKRAALDAAENERAALMGRLAGMDAELAGARQRGPVAATGFEGIAGIETERRDGGIAVRVPGDVLFASGKVDLRDESKRTLDQIAAVLNREYAGSMVRVEGYTDTDPIRKSKWTDNLELSLQRAAAVHRHLASKGVDANRMYAAGFGQWQPRDTKPKSRRVEIVVLAE
jgi:flagellar motor protein MotB